MAFKEDDLNEIIDDLYEDPAGYGSIVRNLMNKSSRFILNFPIIGAARKVADELKKGPFSLYYKFERTLAHKLHPTLFEANLNIITNDRIERQYKDRFYYYENMIPAIKKNTLSLDPLKDLITSMVDRDGHFMVIKYCDYDLQNQNASLANHLRSMEFKVNYLKKHLTKDEDANREMVKKKCDEFTGLFGENRQDLFIDRLRLDDILHKYIPFLTGEDDSSSTAASSKTLNYADIIKKKYLMNKSPDDLEGIESVIKAVEKSNAKQHGEEKSKEIMKQILDHWLQDDELADKKEVLEQIYMNNYSSMSEFHDDEDTSTESLFDSISDETDESKSDVEMKEEDPLKSASNGDIVDPEDIDIDIDFGPDDDVLDSDGGMGQVDVSDEEHSEMGTIELADGEDSGVIEFSDEIDVEEKSFDIAPSHEEDLGEFEIRGEDEDLLNSTEIPEGELSETDLFGTGNEVDESTSLNSVDSADAEKENDIHSGDRENRETDELNSFEISDESVNEDLDQFDVSEVNDVDSGTYDIEDKTKEGAPLQGFEIEDETEPEESGDPFEISDVNDDESGEFEISDEEISEDETGIGAGQNVNNSESSSFAIADKDFLDEARKKLQIIDAKIIDREAEKKLILDSLSEKTDDEAFSIALKLRHNELNSNGKLKAEELMGKLSEKGNIFFKIVRYLEDGPFQYMTLREKKELVDKLISQYKENPDLAQKLEEYKKTLANIPEMLSEIFANLRNIEKEFPDKIDSRKKQITYLGTLLDDDDYEPLWKTIRNLYDNILEDQSIQKLDSAIIVNETEEQWKQALILEQFKNIYKDNPEAIKKIKDAIENGSFNKFYSRIKKEEAGQPIGVETVMKSVTGEDVDVASLAESFSSVVNAKPDNVANDEVKEKLIGMVHEAGDLSMGKPVELLEEVKALLQSDDSSAIDLVENLLETTEEVLRDLIVEEYGKSDNPLHKELYLMHSAVNSVDSLEEKSKALNAFTETFPDSEIPEHLLESKKNKIKNDIIENDAVENITNGFSAEDHGNLESSIKEISQKNEIPAKIKNTALKISEAVDNKKFKEAFLAITSSNNKSEMKIGFLETLKSIAISKSWIKEGDKNCHTIEMKIKFYQSLIGNSNERKKRFKVKQKDLTESVKKSSSRASGSQRSQNKTVHDSKNEELSEKELEKLPANEQAFRKTLSLVKNFQENIDALEPIIPYLKQILDEDHYMDVSSAINKTKKKSNYIVAKTLNMIKEKTIDDEIINMLNTTGPKERYLWGEKIMTQLKVSKLEEAFKPFIKDKKLPESIDRIIRVIKSNNKNDFLKTSVQKENSLLSNIAKNLTEEDLKKLKLKTRSSQDKEKISFFRDLIRLKGGFIPNHIDIHESTKETIERTEKGDIEKPFERELENSVVSDNSPKELDLKKEVENLLTVLTTYINAVGSTSPLLQKTSEKYLPGVNNILLSIGREDPIAMKLVEIHKSDVIKLFVFIIKNKKAADFPGASSALQSAMKTGLIKKEDLQ